MTMYFVVKIEDGKFFLSVNDWYESRDEAIKSASDACKENPRSRFEVFKAEFVTTIVNENDG